MQMWTKIGSHHLNALLNNPRYKRRKADMTINVPGLKSPVNIDDNYGLRLTAYYRVSAILNRLVRSSTLSEMLVLLDESLQSTYFSSIMLLLVLKIKSNLRSIEIN